MAETSVRSRQGRLAIPRQSIIGGALLILAWPIAWSGREPWTWYTFVPLWLGYIFSLDGINLMRTGTSLLTRSRREFAFLFLTSAPLWWIFELFNLRIDNWFYTIPFSYTRFEYVVLGSIAFSTVVPAIFETADFYRSLIGRRAIRWVPAFAGDRGWIASATLGLAMVGLVLLFPGQAFPLVWVSVFFLIDGINRRLGVASVTAQTAARRWDTVVILILAGLTCGFFWEMWNYWSVPKWTYSVPHAGFLPIFEMPILGYLGYIPFSLEVFALHHLLRRALGQSRPDYVAFDDLGPADQTAERAGSPARGTACPTR
ncbi:MAG: hypothetical protein H0U40_00270 [Chloroflexia bacterium]|nr:hypothetical protein [Chloroflexia bacterium]